MSFTMKKIYSSFLWVAILMAPLSARAAELFKQKVDPVEKAGATLAQTLVAQQYEQALLMQMRIQEYAVFREGAFLDPTAPVKKETVTDSLAFMRAAAYRRTRQIAKAASILQQIAPLQTVSGAFLYAAPRYTNSDGDTYSDLPSVASTGWEQIARSLLQGSSPFWNPD